MNLITSSHGSSFFLWWWALATISVSGTEIVHASRHLAYRPQTDAVTLSSIYHHVFTSTAHVIGRALRSHHYWHNILMIRAGVRCTVFVAMPLSPWDVSAITQPQGATEEFLILSLTREQMLPHTVAVNRKDANTALLSYLPVLNKICPHNELNIHGSTQQNRHDITTTRRYSRWLIFKH